MILYQFDMYPLKIGKYTCPETVYAYDQELLKLFMKQHGFDYQHAIIKVIDTNHTQKIPKLAEHQLYMWKLGSNVDHKIHTIATTYNIMENIVNSVAYDLTSCIRLGAPSLRGDIEIFSHISKLIDKLPFITVLDGADLEDAGYPTYESYAMDESQDTIVYEEMFAEVDCDGPFQPITLETYVHLFTTYFILG